MSAKPKFSPWFNARTQPPVNGGDDAVYELMCPQDPGTGAEKVARWVVIERGRCCAHCQWRGLLRESGDGK